MNLHVKKTGKKIHLHDEILRHVKILPRPPLLNLLKIRLKQTRTLHYLKMLDYCFLPYMQLFRNLAYITSSFSKYLQNFTPGFTSKDVQELFYVHAAPKIQIHLTCSNI